MNAKMAYASESFKSYTANYPILITRQKDTDRICVIFSRSFTDRVIRNDVVGAHKTTHNLTCSDENFRDSNVCPIGTFTCLEMV